MIAQATETQPTSASSQSQDLPGSTERWELVRQMRRAWRITKWVLGGCAVMLMAGIVIEAVEYYDFFASVHWLLGYAYLTAVTVGFVGLVGMPLWRYSRLPIVLSAPDVHIDDEDLTNDQLARRARFVARYCRCTARNPELAARRVQLDVLRSAAHDLARRARSAGPGLNRKLVDDLVCLETERVAPILKELDQRVDAYIRAEAVNVGIATAVSMNGTLDAFIVLWRNANMVSRIGRFYYGRAGIRGSLRILGDVAGAVVLGRAMDDLSDLAGDCAGRALGSVAGIFVGPVVDGSVNALMTMKVGHLAKRRCRSFEAWNESVRRGVLSAVMRRVATESTGVVKEVAVRVGGASRHAAMAVTNTVASSSRDAWHFVCALLGPRRGKTVPGTG